VQGDLGRLHPERARREAVAATALQPGDGRLDLSTPTLGRIDIQDFQAGYVLVHEALC
jgi:hypothetical protein